MEDSCSVLSLKSSCVRVSWLADKRAVSYVRRKLHYFPWAL